MNISVVRGVDAENVVHCCHGDDSGGPADDVSSSSAGYRAGMRAAILFH